MTIEHLTSERFDEHVDAALRDDTLRGALDRATEVFRDRREAALREMPQWEELRTAARATKERVLDDIETYLDRFEENARSAGAVVHRAEDGPRACRIIGDLLREHGARTVVKSKSMTTEEIGLNHVIERELGLLPVETDLGEWIIQLAGELPSHIIAPAIHKTRQQIAELFEEKIGLEPTDDLDVLTNAARAVLRQSFADSDVGISGVNFAIAETGSILVLENEGNARLSTSMPRVHIAVMGIEKLLPELKDLALFLRLLPRSGTGQHLTSYQSLITGPARTGDDEAPAEMHIVILDNGRRAMLKEELTKQSLACIRCGACLNACPVYREVGGHAYGSVYPGPIGSVITPQMSGLEKTSKLPFASSLCGACRDVCPVKIDLPRLLLHLRHKVKSGQAVPGHPDSRAVRAERPFSERLAFRAWAWSMAGERRYALASRLGRWVTRAVARGGLAGKVASRLAPPLAGWARGRTVQPFARKSFREQWRERGGAS